MPLIDDIYEHGFHVCDDALDHDIFLQLQKSIQTLEQEAALQPAKIGHQHTLAQNLTIRRDTIHWLDKYNANVAIQSYFNKLNELSSQLNEAFFLGLSDEEAHFAIYQPGDFYKKHVDQFKQSSERRISCVYYLNNLWTDKDGGELKLYDTQDQPLATILPAPNRLIVFKSDLPHEVCVTTKKRYSITAWLKVRKL